MKSIIICYFPWWDKPIWIYIPLRPKSFLICLINRVDLFWVIVVVKKSFPKLWVCYVFIYKVLIIKQTIIIAAFVVIWSELKKASTYSGSIMQKKESKIDMIPPTLIFCPLFLFSLIFEAIFFYQFPTHWKIYFKPVLVFHWVIDLLCKFQHLIGKIKRNRFNAVPNFLPFDQILWLK